MNIAWPLRGNSLRAELTGAVRAPRIATVEFHDSLPRAEPVWRRLQSEMAWTTPYQAYDFLASWYRHVGRMSGVTPFIVTAHDPSGRPLLLWPFGHADQGPFRLLRFLGGKHANFNLGLWNCEFAASATAEDIRCVIERIGASGFGIDLLALHRLPVQWDGIANPLLLLSGQPSPSDATRRDLRRTSDGAIDLTVSRSMRKQLRSKDRKLAQLPGYRYFLPAKLGEVDRLLDWFFPVKAAHFAAQGLANVFAEPGTEDFLRDVCRHRLADGRPLVELHAIEGDGEPLAVLGGIGDGRRFSAMFNTYTSSPLARYSPGLVLLTHLVVDLGERGFTSLDLGAGDAGYKRGFCSVTEPLFESFVPLTVLGQFVASGFRLATALKRSIKRTPALWSTLQAWRRHVYTG